MYFQGRALWHASAAIHSSVTHRPIDARRWQPRQRAVAERAIKDALTGVGDSRVPERVELGELALHVRRVTTPAEEMQVALARMQHGR